MATFVAPKHKSTKKFFWAITSQIESFLSGYLRISLSNQSSFPESIKLLVAKFACNLFIDSKILRFNEIDPFLSLLSNQFNDNKLHFKLLHRGSDNNFNVKLLRDDIFNKYTEYIILISTSHGNTFGIYNNFKKINNNNQNQSHPYYHYGFEFVVNSPNHYLPKLFAPRTNERLYYQSCWGRFESNFTYIRSKNCFIALPEQDLTSNDSFCVGNVGFHANNLCGGIDSSHFMNHQAFKFKIIDYEIFEILSPTNYQTNIDMKPRHFLTF